MGVNNRARRAAKRRKQQRGEGNRWYSSAHSTRSGHEGGSARVDVRRLLLDTLGLVQAAPDAAAERAQQLLGGDCADAVTAELKRLLIELTAAVLSRNWTHLDLAEITRRRLSAPHLALVAALCAQPPTRDFPHIASAASFQTALEVGALLQTLPPIADSTASPGARPRDGGPSPAALAKVPALLAKAESTEFPAEAEALSAKAQELIATYALDRYAEQLAGSGTEPSAAVRRVWLDTPYVDAKAMLVDAVAAANHCRSVFSSHLGFVTLIGQTADVEATELVVTSLQVQADRAMLRHGRSDDRYGNSRTRSFRRSFLISYATRIGERLRQATDETLAASTQSQDLVPVLTHNDERVRMVTEELFPQLVSRRTRISNGQGWVAGRAAADLAQLNARDQVAHRPAS